MGLLPQIPASLLLLSSLLMGRLGENLLDGDSTEWYVKVQTIAHRVICNLSHNISRNR
ncbi:hypothetical protein NIES4103_00360 [Nostoc sp. NIES-4103]|nr:hypothetical protein NIES4103_00360 [Nostoc sp. NIES-4103]